jgi:hypothetical protein
MDAAAGLWTLGEDSASLHCGALEGRVTFDDAGVRFVTDRWQRQPCNQFRVLATGGPSHRAPNLQIDERYVRGGDLVMTYEKTGPHRLAPQIYWRASISIASTARLEMVLSMQTDLLDSRPHSTVCSVALKSKLFHAEGLIESRFEEIASGADPFDCSRATEHLFVFRNEELGLSYAEMVHPSDFVSVALHRDQERRPWMLESTLFPERLEKGVIRRGRICGWFLPAENDLAVAVELAKRFVDEPLPLTT